MLALLLAASALQAQAQPAPPDPRASDVVVTAQSLDSTQAALDACLARKCPPREDIEASLAHGENLFVAGDYVGARRVLRHARARNIGHAEALPVEVADLTRAYGRVAAFDGMVDVSRLSQIESVEALRAGLDRDDARVLGQQMLVAEEFLRRGQTRVANDMYRSIEKRAIKARLPMVQGRVLLRQAAIQTALADRGWEYRSQADVRIKALERTSDPALQPFRDAAAILRIQLLALDAGDDGAFDAAIAALKPAGFRDPLLVYMPPIAPDWKASGRMVEKDNVVHPQWIDVAFEVTRDGRVADIAILRRTDTLRGTWPDDVRAALARRRYAPIGPGVDPARLHRVERFSMVYDLTRPNGSRWMMRDAGGHVMSIDLTGDPPPRPVPPAAAATATAVTP